MAPVREVSFDLERFGWVEDGRLEVIGRWSGLRGRRVGRVVLRVAGRRLPALAGGSPPAADEPWRAEFAYDGDPAAVKGAELEIGRSLVVDLPPPRRRRRRPGTSETPTVAAARDLAVARAEAEAARTELGAARAELSALRDASPDAAALAAARAELAAAPDPDEVDAMRAELTELREAASATVELNALRVTPSERKALRAELAAARADAQSARAELAALRESPSDADEIETLRAELAAAQADAAALRE